jgi:hypothetical protein
MRRTGDGVRVEIEAGTRIPAGGIAVRTPLPSLTTATVNGTRTVPNSAREIVVRELPAVVLARP